MKRALPLLFLLSACGSPPNCEQPTHTSADVSSQATQDLRLTLEAWSHKESRVVELTVSLPAGKATNLHMENGSRTKEPHYHGKLDLDPTPPSCTDVAEEHKTSLYLSKASFDLAKACFERYSSKLLIVDPNTACPDGTFEQKTPGYPNAR